MLRFVVEEYLPEIVAHVEFANEWQAERPDLVAGTNGLENPAARGIAGGGGLIGGGAATFAWRGVEVTTSVMPYHLEVWGPDLGDTSSTSAAVGRFGAA